MKKFLVVLVCSFCSCAALAAGGWMYSRDGINPGSKLRELPSAGVNLETRKIVVGLHALTDAERMACGWYRFAGNAKPDTNHYWRVTGYTFTATGTVYAVWSEYTPKARPLRYSKFAIIEALDAMGKWDAVKAAIEQAGFTDRWNACTYIEGGNPRFQEARPQIAAVLGMTIKELDEMLERCTY